MYIVSMLFMICMCVYIYSFIYNIYMYTHYTCIDLVISGG